MTRDEKWLFIALALLGVALVSRGPSSLAGHTIHYLALTHSLVFDRDFDLRNQYTLPGDAIFFPGNPDGHTRLGRNGNLHTLHPIGFPIAMTPVYALAAVTTSAIPEKLLETAHWDRARACRDLLSLAMILLYAWTAVLTLRATRVIRQRQEGGTLAVVVAFVTPPLISLSILVFPEVPAAWLLAWFVVEMTKAKPRPWATILPLALIPWLHLRFALVSAVGLGWLIVRGRKQGLSTWASAATTLPYVLFSLVLLTLSNRWISGSFSLIEDQGLLGGWSGLAGLFLDPDYGLLIVAPFWLVALGGVGSLRSAHPQYLWFAVLSFLSLWLSAGSMIEWWGGVSPPARLLVPSLPLLVPLLAASLERLSGSWLRWLAYSTMAWASAITVIFIVEPIRMWADPEEGLSLLPPSFTSFTTERLARRRLANDGIDVNPRSYLASVRRGDIELVRTFLEAGFSAGVGLPEAARQGRAEVLKLLLEKAEPENLSAATALGWALSNGHADCARALEDAGVDLEARTRTGETALIQAAQLTRLRPLRALVKAGADVHAATSHGMTALMFSAQADHEMAVRTLIRAGADVNARDRDGWTPLMLAARTGARRVVEVLIAEGADVNAVTGLGWTALLWAASEGHAPIVTALVTSGANVNYQSKAGQTALIRAAQSGHTEVVKRLIEAGADPCATADGLDARAWAELNGHRHVSELLEEAASARGN